MEEYNNNIKEAILKVQLKLFYDYLRFTIARLDFSTEVKETLEDYLDKMSIEALDRVESLIDIYESYYNMEINSFQLLDQKIADNKDSDLIAQIFNKELGDLSLKQEKLGFIKNLLDNVKDMVRIKKESLKSRSRV